MSDEINMIKENDAVPFMEGPELCRKYVQTEKITFGTSRLPVGGRGAKDPGHKDSEEVFFCIEGRVLLFVEESDNYYEMSPGDAVLVHKGVSHTLINIGDVPALLSWSMAPSE